jgi:hypothetical protein
MRAMALAFLVLAGCATPGRPELGARLGAMIGVLEAEPVRSVGVPVRVHPKWGPQTKWINTMTKNPVTDGTHEDHVRAGQQSHKNTAEAPPAKDGQHDPKHGGQGGTHEQHVKAGEQSHKNAPAASGKMDAAPAPHPGGQGGTHEQHVAAGAQSHKKT